MKVLVILKVAIAKALQQRLHLELGLGQGGWLLQLRLVTFHRVVVVGMLETTNLDLLNFFHTTIGVDFNGSARCSPRQVRIELFHTEVACV